MVEKIKVGFAGLGMMGMGMAKNLVKAGFDVKVYNRTRSKADEVIRASVAEHPSGLSDCQIIFICVSNDSALKQVLFDEDGLFNVLSSSNVLVDSSTTSVALTEEISKKCAKKNIEFLDAPVTGGKKGAEDGTLLFMVGGNKYVLESYTKVFSAMGKKVVHCGPASYGQRMKIALNLTQSMMLESYLEGLSLAVKNGVPLNSVIEVLDNSGAKNGVATGKMPTILSRDFSPTFYLELMNKDLTLAEHEISKLKMNLPLSKEMINILKDAHKKHAKEDWTAIVKVLEERNKIEIKK